MSSLMGILGYRHFKSPSAIRNAVKTSINYHGENTDLAQMFHFFETHKQKTWFVATNKRIYIILDDIRKPDVKVNKSYSIEKPLDLKQYIKVESGIKSNTGRIYFSPRAKGWLYSKSLFPNPEELKSKIIEIVKIAQDI